MRLIQDVVIMGNNHGRMRNQIIILRTIQEDLLANGTRKIDIILII